MNTPINDDDDSILIITPALVPWLVGLIILLIFPLLIFLTLGSEDAGRLGDTYNVMTSAFNAFALLVTLYTLQRQQKQLAQQERDAHDNLLIQKSVVDTMSLQASLQACTAAMKIIQHDVDLTEAAAKKPGAVSEEEWVELYRKASENYKAATAEFWETKAKVAALRNSK